MLRLTFQESEYLAEHEARGDFSHLDKYGRQFTYFYRHDSPISRIWTVSAQSYMDDYLSHVWRLGKLSKKIVRFSTA